MVARTGAHALLIGGVGGVALSVAAGQGLAGLLSVFGARSFDPVVLGGVVVVLVGAAGVAMLAPVRRALRVDPMVALREE